MISFNAGQPISFDQLSAQQSTTSSLFYTLNGTQIQTILWFATGLVEEVNKADSASIQNHKYYERVSSNVADVVELLHHSIEAASRGDFGLAEHGVKCFRVCGTFPVRPSLPAFSLKKTCTSQAQDDVWIAQGGRLRAALCVPLS